MNGIRRWFARLLEWRRSDSVEQDMAAELQSHLEHLIDDHIRRGLSPTEARRAAQLELGGVEQARSLVRDARGFRLADAVVTDTKLAVRQLLKTPTFTVAAILTLALGTGANTAIFTLVDAVLLRPLPYGEPERVVALWEEASGQPLEPQRIAVAPANLADYRAQVSSLQFLSAYSAVGRNVTGNGAPERLLTEDVSLDYFHALGVQPAAGRGFSPDQFDEGRAAVISHDLWRRRFASDPDVIGRTIRLDQRPVVVIGVMPEGFVAPSAVGTADTVDAWLPMVLDNDVLTNRQEHIVSVVGRLAPGASLDSARAELSTVSGALAQAFPESATIRARLDLLHRDQTTTVRTMFATLLGAVTLVLLLACVNVAGLLLVRAVARRRDTAVRLALGASRGRILLEQLIQSSVLATAGGAAGLLLGHWLTRLLVGLAPPTIPHIETATLDLRVVMFAVGVTVATAFLAGLWPAWRAAQAEPVESIGSERSPGGRGVVGRRGGLLVAEVALSTVLLVGALLMVRSLVVLGDVDLGFSPDNVLAATVALPADRYPTPLDRFRFFDTMSEQIDNLPGVVSVAYGNRLPLRGNWISGMVIDPVIPSAIEPEFREAGFQAVSPGYFSTLGIPSRRGRLLTSQDVGTGEPVAVVNESFVRTLLDGDDPLGRRIRRGPGMPPMTIVGVVGDIRRTGRADEEGRRAAEVVPQVYIPAAQTQLYPLPLRDIAVKLESQAAVGDVSAAIQRLVHDRDPDQPVTTVRTLEDSLALRSAQQRFHAGLFLTFAVVAFGLALVGVYGVVAYATSQRAPEMALRMALGASAAGVVATMVGGFARLIAIGVLAGLGMAWLASDVMASQLFEIRGTDPITYLGAGLLIATAGLIAALVAARQAGGANVSDVLK